MCSIIIIRDAARCHTDKGSNKASSLPDTKTRELAGSLREQKEELTTYYSPISQSTILTKSITVTYQRLEQQKGTGQGKNKEYLTLCM